MDQTRRALLRRTIPLAAAGGLAGCSAFSGDESTETGMSNGSTTDSGSEPGTDTSTAAPTGGADAQAGQWLPAPSVAEQDHYNFITLQPAGMAEYSDALPNARTANFDTQIGLAGFSTVGSLRSVHQTGIGLTVYDGPFERSPLETQLTDAGFSDDGSYGEFDVYSADEQRVVAIGDRQVAQVDLRRLETSVTGGTVLEAAIDARNGAGERYEQADEDVDALLSALGSGHVVSCQTGSTALDDGAAIAQGGRWRIGSDTTSVATAVVFDSTDATDVETVESWASTAGPFGDATPSISTDGRVVTARADVPTGDLGPFEVSASDGGEPQVAVDFAYDEAAGTVTITHNGGDAVPVDALEIQGSGFADRESADQTSAGQWAGSVSGEGDTVVAGDSVVVGVTPDYQLLVLYTSGSDGGVTLGSDTGPEA